MTNEDRFWEASIAEAATGIEPPDQTSEILARLQAPEHAPTIQTPQARFFGGAWRVAVAAAVLVAIGMLTGIIPWPGALDTDTGPGPDGPVQEAAFVASDDARWEIRDGVLYLESGMVLLGRDAPVVVSGGSRLESLEGMALALAGEVPDAAGLEDIKRWLEQQKVEEQMKNTGKWFRGAALAVLMLSGSAMLDNQLIRAEPGPEPAPEAATPWHAVQMVMEIDLLPEDVRYVELRAMHADALEFLVEHPGLAGVRLMNVTGMRNKHLSLLAGVKGLQILEFSTVYWDELPDYVYLTEMPNLRRVTVPLSVTMRNPASERQPAGYIHTIDDIADRVRHLKAVQASGAELVFERLPSTNAEGILEAMHDLVPGLQVLRFDVLSDSAVPFVLKFEDLRVLDIARTEVSELGMARLSRVTTLEELVFAMPPSASQRLHLVAYFHHIGRMAGLRRLAVNGLDFRDAAEAFGKLEGLDQLESIELGGSMLIHFDPAVLRALPAVRTLHLDLLVPVPMGRALHRTAIAPQDMVGLAEVLPHIRAEELVLSFTQHISTRLLGGLGPLHTLEPFTGQATGSIKRLTIKGAPFAHDAGDEYAAAFYSLLPHLEELELVVPVESRLTPEGNETVDSYLAAFETHKPAGVTLSSRRE